ncbi:MAG: HlyD family type I secretion periplasmic adaptor subunit [Betaproteobacteria bacterium]|nr:HlyD family type I secretion periplasmic adaptor subunit [Betaproteobacteria bacterium]
MVVVPRDALERPRWLLWAVVAVTSLSACKMPNEVARGEGRVTPSMGGQTISAVEAGMIKEILVKEGQEVVAGQVLLCIDSSRFVSEVGPTEATRLGLLARVARLQALTNKSKFVMPEDVLNRSPDIAAQEQRLYQTSLDEADALLSGLREQLTQREQELREVEALHGQAVEGLRYAKLELEQRIPLLQSSPVSEFEILELEKEIARLDGDRKLTAERIGHTRAAISEAKSKIEEAEHGLLNKWRQMLADASSELATVTVGAVANWDKVEPAEVRSPMNGTVKRLHVKTVGGFVPQGKELVEIAPLVDYLLIEAKIKPRDIGFLREGLPTLVKITAYDIYGWLEGTLEHISPDSITDERDNTFYLIKVRTNGDKLADGEVVPGMTADVVILRQDKIGRIR